MDGNMSRDLGRAKFVKQERIGRAWPQSQLATVAGVSLRTIQRLEKDGVAAFETLMAVAQALEIDVKQLNSNSSPQDRATSHKAVHLMPRLTSGKDLADIVGGAEQFQIKHDAADDKRALGAMMEMLKELKGDIVNWYDADLVGKLKIELYLSQAIKELDAFGFYLFGLKREIPRIVGNRKTQISMCTIYMSHSRSPKIIRDQNSNMMWSARLQNQPISAV